MVGQNTAVSFAPTRVKSLTVHVVGMQAISLVVAT